MPVKTKTCPSCSKFVPTAASECQHCGEAFRDAPEAGAEQHTLIRDALASRFEILEEIGKGGMSIVYKAIQKNLNRTVALKVLPQQFTTDEEFLARFHREAQAAASLSHPNLVTIFDEGRENGVHFIAMEFVEGEDLQSTVRRNGPFSIPELKRCMVPLAEGLGYAHEEGVIHRDIKSSNILIDKKGRPVLMDFGIARAAKAADLTHHGTVLGTPEYMSPEQALGEGVDKRSDIFSLGVVMYECLSGRVPFQSDSALGTIYKIVDEPPAPLRMVRPEVPAKLERLVLRCLAKKAADRYQSCYEIVSALQNKEVRHVRPLAVGKPMPERQPDITGAAAILAGTGSGKSWLARAIVTALLVGTVLWVRENYAQFKQLIFERFNDRGSSAEPANVEILMRQAQAYFDENQLTTPEGANAFETVQKVRAIDANNLGAERIAEKIAFHYLEWGKTQMAGGNLDRARYYYSKALHVSEDKPAIRAQAEAAIAKVSAHGLEKFVGTWTKEMPGVRIKNEIEIASVPTLAVGMKGGWNVHDEKFNGEVLSFRAARGVIGQEFLYRIKYLSPNRLELTVLNTSDNTVLAGLLVR